MGNFAASEREGVAEWIQVVGRAIQKRAVFPSFLSWWGYLFGQVCTAELKIITGISVIILAAGKLRWDEGSSSEKRWKNGRLI